MTLKPNEVYADAEGYLWLVIDAGINVFPCRGLVDVGQPYEGEGALYFSKSGKCFGVPKRNLIKRIGTL